MQPAPSTGFHDHLDSSAFGRELHRIAEEVRDDLTESHPITDDGHRLELLLDREPFRVEAWLQHRELSSRQLSKLYRFAVEHGRRHVGVRERVEVLHQRAEAQDFLVKRREPLRRGSAIPSTSSSRFPWRTAIGVRTS